MVTTMVMVMMTVPMMMVVVAIVPDPLPPSPPLFFRVDLVKANRAVLRWTEPLFKGGEKVRGYRCWPVGSGEHRIKAARKFLHVSYVHPLYPMQTEYVLVRLFSHC